MSSPNVAHRHNQRARALLSCQSEIDLATINSLGLGSDEKSLERTKEGASSKGLAVNLLGLIIRPLIFTIKFLTSVDFFSFHYH